MSGWRQVLGLLGAVATALVIATVPLGIGADHLDQPFPGLAPEIDITDVYLFHPGTSAQDLSKVVLVLNVNPLTMPGLHPAFSSVARYNLKVDINGDAVADLAYRITFGPASDDGRQGVTVTMLRGNNARSPIGRGVAVVRGMTEQAVQGIDGHVLFAGLRDDPFFFDLPAFRGAHAFCDPILASDFFTGFNVKSIVLQVNSDVFGEESIGVWATIELPDASGSYFQQDRMGRPAINTVLISTGNKAAFNAGQPKDDRQRFGQDVIEHLVALDPQHEEARAEFLASVLLPDLLTMDVTMPSAFLNGRGLADDVIDAELGLLTRGALPEDCVDGNDVPFLGAFPYLAPPH